MSVFDRWVGIGLSGLGIIIILASLQFPSHTGRYGPGFFPIIVASGLVFVSLLLVFRDVKAERRAPGSESSVQKKSQTIILMVGLVIIFAVFVFYLGLALGTFIFFILYQRLFYFHNRIKTVIVAIAASGIIWGVFVQILGISLNGQFF